MSFASIFASQGSANSRLDEANNSMMIGGLSKVPRSQQSSPCQIYYSDDDYDLFPPTGKRLAPVGAASNEDEDVMASKDASSADFHLPVGPSSSSNELEERLRQMEEDQEELNTSLMSLTSHFAKVSQITYMYY